MSDQQKTVITPKRRRGPRPTGKGELIGVRLQPDLLSCLDAYRAELPGDPSRPEAIRELLTEMLRNLGYMPK